MKPFAFLEPASVAEAVRMLGETEQGNARPIAGGSDLLGELKESTAHYERLVSLGRIAGLDEIDFTDDTLRLGARVTLATLEHEARLSGPWALLAEAARGVATPEIRNQGTLGGNLCQRPRCLHYRSRWLDCRKKGGANCPAEASEHQGYLSVFGGQGCVATCPSDLAPPLLALDATAAVAGPAGERTLPLADFFAGPEHDVRREHVLGPDELLTHVIVPRPHEDWRGTYLKARERTAGDFALVSAAFGCRLADGRMRDVRLVLGGVAPVPRPCPEAAALLEGEAPSEALAERAGQTAFADARPLAHNAYKLQLGRAVVARAIAQVSV